MTKVGEGLWRGRGGRLGPLGICHSGTLRFHAHTGTHQGYNSAGGDVMDGGQKHIEDRHMQTLDTGVVPLNGPSQYVFDQSPDPSTGKAPTHADNFSLIADINAYTFENGTVSQNRRNFNYVFVATLPPEFPSIRPQAGPSPVRPFIGLDYPGKWVPGTPRYFPTNVNTLVVGPDCKTVQTSHPGKPRGQ